MATIAENLQTIIDIKNDIKTAIINKGVSVADSDSFTTYADKIESIESGGTGGGGESTTEGFDFSVLGYDTTLNNSCNDKIQADIDYSKTILDKWKPSTTSASYKFADDIKLVYCPNIDTSNVTNMNSMFNNCKSLTTIPLLNTSKVTDMGRMFNYCSPLRAIPQLNTINVTNMYYMFNNCVALTSIPLLNTSKVTDMSYMFSYCSSLITIPLLDTSKVTNMNQMFFNCSSLTTLPAIDTSKVTDFRTFIDITKLQSLPVLDMGSVSSSSNLNNFFGYSTTNNTTLTEVGGFKNLKVDWTDNYGVKRLANLTYESVMNIINNLYDFRTNGDTTTTRTIALNAKSKALLLDEDIAVATNKGWTIS